MLRSSNGLILPLSRVVIRFARFCVSCAARAHNSAANNLTRAHSSPKINEPTTQPPDKTYTRGRMHLFVHVTGGYVPRFCFATPLNVTLSYGQPDYSSLAGTGMRACAPLMIFALFAPRNALYVFRAYNMARGMLIQICKYTNIHILVCISLYPSSELWRVQHGLNSERRTSAKFFN